MTRCLYGFHYTLFGGEHEDDSAAVPVFCELRIDRIAVFYHNKGMYVYKECIKERVNHEYN